jgi:hypothetical protein
MSRIILTIAIWLAFAAGVAAQAQPARAQRPNVILINADDLGLPDITAYGGRKAVPTPNIDRSPGAGSSSPAATPQRPYAAPPAPR